LRGGGLRSLAILHVAVGFLSQAGFMNEMKVTYTQPKYLLILRGV
jgi:hypothetical protein